MKGCRALKEVEIRVVLDAFKCPRDRALFILGLRTGFRISELLSIRVSDVWQLGQVTESVYVARKHMKKQVEGRSVPLHPDARAAIAALIQAEDLKPHHWLFRSRKGANRPIGRVHAWAVFKRAFSSAGVTGKTGTHTARKTFAARVYERLGRDLVKTQHALGHKSISSTVSYLAVDSGEIASAILAL